MNSRSGAYILFLTAAFAAFGLTLLAFYPGCMDYDSYMQYLQVVTGRIYSHHPPGLTYVWQFTNHIIEGPAGLFLLHATLYWIAIAVLCYLCFTTLPVRLLFLFLLGLFPPVFILSIQVGKDAATLCGFLFATAMIMLYLHTHQLRWLVASLAALTFGALAKHAAMTAAIPLVGYVSYLAVRHPLFISRLGRHIKAATVAVFTVLCVFFLSFSHYVNRVNVTQISMWPSVQVWDIAAISLLTDTMLLPEYLLRDKNFDLVRLREVFDETTVPPLCAAGVKCREATPFQKRRSDKPRVPFSKSEVAQLSADWHRIVREHWREYLYHRLRITGYLLGVLSPPPERYPYTPGCIESQDFTRYNLADYNIHVAANHSWLNSAAFKSMFILKDTLFFRGWFYLLLAGGAAVYSLRRVRTSAHAQLSLVLAVSAVLYFLPRLVITAALDFRYNIWLVAGSPLAVLCGFVSYRQKG